MIRQQMKPYWHSRLVIAVWSIHLPFVAWAAPESLSWTALGRSGPMGHYMLALLAFFAFFALVDLVGERYEWSLTTPLTEHRHVGFLAMGITLAMIAAALAHMTSNSPLIVAYILPACFSASVAWLDMAARHRKLS